jgi:hypothetical protein
MDINQKDNQVPIRNSNPPDTLEKQMLTNAQTVSLAKRKLFLLFMRGFNTIPFQTLLRKGYDDRVKRCTML